MEAVAFNEVTTYELIQKLPYAIHHTFYDITEEGKPKMVKILHIIAQQRQKAQRRATDATNHPPAQNKPSSHLTTLPAAPNVNQNLQTPLTPSTPQSSNPKHRFASWSNICQFSGRLYPTPEDFYTNTCFHVAPDDFKTHSVGTRYGGCRVCQYLDRSGNHKGNLYMGHYANYPTHCPQWAPMTIEERIKVIKEIGMCMICLNPKYTVKTEAEKKKHQNSQCSVRKYNKKNKYTCLNTDCSTHSWLCLAHKEENKPLYDTHQKEFIERQQHIIFSHPVILKSPKKRSPTQEEQTPLHWPP